MRSAIWRRLALAATVAGGLLVVLAPAAPAAHLEAAPAAAAGAAAGLLLYLVVARRRPYAPPLVPPALAVHRPVVAAAARRSCGAGWCSGLLRAGPVVAVAGSTLCFALAHRARPVLHLGTGAAFGGLYVTTGALAASIAAHWAYNVFLLALAERGRARDAR
jgi:membrane protease YdiL (CAAX protease family)